jgi:hypothetical protein
LASGGTRPGRPAHDDSGADRVRALVERRARKIVVERGASGLASLLEAD